MFPGHWLVFAMLSASIAVSTPARADFGVTDNEILIGECTALSGSASERAGEVKKGADIEFNKINAAGGIAGRKIRVIAEDDGYEPQRTVVATRKLLTEDKVFALFQYFGTPGAKAILPLLKESGTPLIAPNTGSEFLRNPVQPNVFNVRVGYMDEGKAMVDYLVGKRGIKELGLIYQDDSFGSEGKAATSKALNEYGIKLLVEIPYKRNGTDMGPIMEKLQAAGVKGVLAWVLNAQATEMAKEAAALSYHPLMTFMSGVTSARFAEDVRRYNLELYHSYAVPLLTDKSNTLVQQYLADARSAAMSPGQAAFEGYINASVLVEALKKAGKDLNHKSLADALESLGDLNLAGGLKIRYSPQDHRGIHSAYIVQVKDGKLIRLAD